MFWWCKTIYRKIVSLSLYHNSKALHIYSFFKKSPSFSELSHFWKCFLNLVRSPLIPWFIPCSRCFVGKPFHKNNSSSSSSFSMTVSGRKCSVAVSVNLIHSCPGSEKKLGLTSFQATFHCNTEGYSEPCQISKMKLFAKIVYSWKHWTIFVKSSSLDVWLGS